VNQSSSTPKILLAPLDWGLGHATRCIPIINELIQHNCQVVLAASGRGKSLLQQEFPYLHMLELPGYNIQYASSGWGLAMKIVAQIPRLLSAIKREQRWLQKVVADEGIDAVISDNRYGLFSTAIPSVFITHQLRIQTPFVWATGLLQQLNYRYISRFKGCWVPDAQGRDNLAGELSHPLQKPPVPLFYTGPLTRFRSRTRKEEGKHLLVLLSGPEPQRTILEKKLKVELTTYSNPVVLVRGLPGNNDSLSMGKNVIVYNHLPAVALEKVLNDASLVISRCGYSTVMDLSSIQKRSILIPTPGQTEQEYLAKHLMQKGIALCVNQSEFRLKNAVALAETFPFQWHQPEESRLCTVVKAFVEKVRLAKAKPIEETE
jgi:uncharacterized protein (TIGR00661 family)